VTESSTPESVLRVSVGDNEQAAYLEVAPSERIDIAAALEYLAEAGIIYGVDAKAVALALEKPATAVLVAEG
jgi:hypothetical protein